VNKLFVYGTLVPGDVAWPRLAMWLVGTPVAAAIPGVLYDTGRGYPPATFDADAAGLVHGVVGELNPELLETALRALDRYEGNEYERVLVRTTAGDEVFAYVWIAPLDHCAAIRSGRWPTP
jgi:gamma-glutamylcyclotransferase (GGCT)/AIG2-like uncharacterized protein YtfP